MLDNAVLSENQLSKEDYLLRRAKEAMSTDIYAAKSWLITARSLFPHSAKVQFEAYRIEKLSKNVKEAAKCFSEIFQNFPDDLEIWAEIDTVTTCLRSEQTDSNSEFLCQMFQHIPQDLQHRLLIMTAEHSEDTMEHCKLLLLLLRRFPQTVATHGAPLEFDCHSLFSARSCCILFAIVLQDFWLGMYVPDILKLHLLKDIYLLIIMDVNFQPRLVETLLTAEKHGCPGQTINDYRRLLTCEALPLIGAGSVDLDPRLAMKLLLKAVEFYLAYIQKPPDFEIQEPWGRLFQVVELMGNKLGWELSGIFSTIWNQDIYSERLQQYVATHSATLNEEVVARQLLICGTIVLLRVLNEHNSLVSNGDVGYCLVEAFAALPQPSMEPKLKKRKREEPPAVIVTSDGDYSGSGLSLAVTLWDLLHATHYLKREFAELCEHQMRLDNWMKPFMTNVAMYKGLYSETLHQLSLEPHTIATELRIASTFYAIKDYKNTLDYILMVMNKLPPSRGKVSHNLSVPSIRHLHYLPLERFPILQYCCRILLEVIKTKFVSPGEVADWAIGNALVLMQIDWPQNAELLMTITERIVNSEAFRYPLFQTYVICIDILEELTYLWTEHGGSVALEIALASEVLQRSRTMTRGADKGVREEVKQTMRRQAARDGIEPIDDLIQRFIINEQAAIMHSLMSK